MYRGKSAVSMLLVVVFDPLVCFGNLCAVQYLGIALREFLLSLILKLMLSFL